MRKVIIVLASALLALSAILAACGGPGNNDGLVFVIGHYTCINPLSGELDYCVEYSDGTSAMVPFGIYNTVPYGASLIYGGGRYTIVRTRVTRSYAAPDVYHVSYHAHSYTSTTKTAATYGGMSYRNGQGRVVYRTASVRSSSISSYRSSSYRGRT